VIPRGALQVDVRGDHVVPRYLTTRDEPWLRAVLDVYARHEGRPRRELEERLREPLPVPCPRDGLLRARHVLDRLCHTRVAAPVPPAEVRAVAFAEAAGGVPRVQALARAARTLGLDAPQVEACLFADLPSERHLGSLPEAMCPSELRLQVNLALVQGLVANAHQVEARIFGNARDVVRCARLRGLLCVVREEAAATGGMPGVCMDLSGPFALFGHTRMYGRALASLVPRLAWCTRYVLAASCRLGGRTVRVEVRSGDPIRPAAEPKRFDSKLEARFARDFARAAPDWEVVREPEPLRAGRVLIFPDFALVHRRDPERRWLLEIAGFWTPGYLENKLHRLREAHVDRMILCIDADRGCDRGGPPAAGWVVPYRRRVDPAAVLDIIEGEPGRRHAGGERCLGGGRGA
jgi:uncharacterized protein